MTRGRLFKEWSGGSLTGLDGTHGDLIFRVSVALVLNGMMCGLLLVGAVFREAPDFWRNSGGGPVLLRECVYWLFYPFWLLSLPAVMGATWAALNVLCSQNRIGGVLLAVCSLEILILLAVVVIVVWNNVANQFHGATIHHHALEPS